MLSFSAIELTESIEEAEISNYSFDKLIVTEQDESANFLISNHFHLQNNCAILSINGYPKNAFDSILNMALRNPNLIVYVVHNASPRGTRLIND